MSQVVDNEMELVEAPARLGPTALEATMRAEIDVAIATAKRFPRNMARIQDRIRTEVRLDKDTAKSCWYTLPSRGGEKPIQGASIRFAEVLGRAWGNMSVGTRVIQEDHESITVQAVAIDHETGYRLTQEVQRPIVGKRGRYNRDMIVMTGNAAQSIARRNVILGIVPRTFWQPVLKEAQTFALSDQTPLAQRQAKAMDWFVSRGISRDRVLALLERSGVQEITEDDLVTLTGIKTGVLEEGQSIESYFPAPEPKEARSLEEVLGPSGQSAPKRRGRPPRAPAAPPAPPPAPPPPVNEEAEPPPVPTQAELDAAFSADEPRAPPGEAANG